MTFLLSFVCVVAAVGALYLRDEYRAASTLFDFGERLAAVLFSLCTGGACIIGACIILSI